MRPPILALALILAALTPASPASAEWFADAYIGASLASNDEITFKTFGVERKQDANYKSSAIFGVRFGKWFDDLPWLGVAVDSSYFRASADVQVVPLTGLLMLRYGFLKDEEVKEGRLQRYAGIGGGVFISNLDGSIGFVEGRTRVPTWDSTFGSVSRTGSSRTGRRSSSIGSPTCRRRTPSSRSEDGRPRTRR